MLLNNNHNRLGVTPNFLGEARTICLTPTEISEGPVTPLPSLSSIDRGTVAQAAVSKPRQFHSPHIFLYLSEETLKTGRPFYLVSMPGGVKYPTHV